MLVHVGNLGKLHFAGTRSTIPAPPLPNPVKVVLATDVPAHLVPDGFQVARHTAETDVIIVIGLSARWHGTLALKARLYGKRLADVDWLHSKGRSGQCVSFMRVLDTCHVVLYLSGKFVEQFPILSKVLREGSLASPAVASGSHRFVVMDGARPVAPALPRLTFNVLSEDEYRAAPAQDKTVSLDLERLMSKLTFMHGPDRKIAL